MGVSFLWEGRYPCLKTRTRPEQALLVALDTGEYDAQASLDELAELTRTAGAEPAFFLTQKRPAPDTATCLGSGMAEEAADLVKREELDLAIFDRELSPTQIRNLEELFGVRVIDRTTLILDISAPAGPQPGGQAPGRAGPAAVSAAPALRPGHGTVPAGGRHRHPGPRRDQAGDRPPPHPAAHQRAEGRSWRRWRPAGSSSSAAAEGRHRHRGPGGLHQRRESPPDEPAHPGRGAGRGQALRHPGPHRPGLEAALRKNRHAHRHGGPHPPPAPPPGGGLQVHVGAGRHRRHPAEYLRRLQPRGRGAPAGHPGPAGGAGGRGAPVIPS